MSRQLIILLKSKRFQKKGLTKYTPAEDSFTTEEHNMTRYLLRAQCSGIPLVLQTVKALSGTL